MLLSSGVAVSGNAPVALIKEVRRRSVAAAFRCMMMTRQERGYVLRRKWTRILSILECWTFCFF